MSISQQNLNVHLNMLHRLFVLHDTVGSCDVQYSHAALVYFCEL